VKSTRIAWILIVSLAALCGSYGALASPSPEPPGPRGESCAETSIVRVYYPDLDTRNEILIAFEPQLLETNYQQGYHILKVTAEDIRRLEAVGLRVEPDETWVAPPVRPPADASAQTIPGYGCYRTVEETYAAAQALVTAHPDLATWSDVGDSWDKATAGGATGYDLMVLKLTNSAISGDKPKLFVTAAIHAREYAPAELVTRFGEYLVNQYGTDADATWLLDYHEVRLMLQANPDGRKRAETGSSWRKNTNNNCWYSAPPSGDGIDLNRNFAFQWGCCDGSSGSACSSTYRGAAAGSEPETEAVQSYLASIFPDQRDPDLGDPAPVDATGIYLDIHSYGELVLWPWGFTSSPAPNATALQTLGRKFAYFNGYSPQQAFALYSTDGTSDSYAYGELGVAAYCFETGTEFFQSCPVFESAIYPDNLQALLYAAKVARTPYLTPLGPDAVNLTVSATSIPAGTPVTLSALISDTGYSTLGGSEPTQNIAAAEYYADVSPWASGATAHAMAVSDGSFDSKSEGVTAIIDTTGWSEGRHIVFVRGQDAGGNWGAFSAIFLDVSGPTSVEVLSFTATGRGTAITLAWETHSEVDSVGFNLYRVDEPDGRKTQINENLIPTLAPPGSAFGAVYEYTDAPVTGGRTYYYWLEAVDIHGHAQLHGPIGGRTS
jgi:carboxypeptidase T